MKKTKSKLSALLTLAGLIVGLSCFGQPLITQSVLTMDQSENFIDVYFSQEVYNSKTGSGALDATDFTLTLLGGTANTPAISGVTRNDNLNRASATGLSGGETIFRVWFTYLGTPNGSEVLTVDVQSNQVFDKSGNAASTGQKNNTTKLILPKIVEAKLNANNDFVDVYFSRGVYGSTTGSPVSDSDLNVALSPDLRGATAPLILSITKNDNPVMGSASSLTGGENVVRIWFNYTGSASGTQKLTIGLVAASVFDDAGNAALSTQSNNEVTLNVPKIVKLSMSPNNDYVDVVFNMNLWTNRDKIGALNANDFVLSFKKDIGKARNIEINSVERIPNRFNPSRVLMPGSARARIYFGYNGVMIGTEIIKVKFVAGTVFSGHNEVSTDHTLQISPSTCYECLTKTLEISSLGQFKTELPINEPFRIKLTGEESKFIYSANVHYYEKGRLRVYQNISKELGNLSRVGDATMLNVAPLEPEKTVMLSLVYKPHGEVLEKLLKINGLLASQKKSSIQKAENEFNDLANSLVNDVDGKYIFFQSSWFEYELFFNSALQQDYDNLDPSSGYVPVYLNETNFESIVSTLATQSLSISEISALASIYKYSKFKELESGSVDLFYDLGSEKGVHEFEARAKNLQESIKSLQKLIQTLDQLIFKDPTVSLTFKIKDDVVRITKKLENSLINQKKSTAKIINTIRSNDKLNYGSFIYGTNKLSTMSQQASYRIIPEIGLVYIPAFTRDNEVQSMFRTYAGASIFIKPVNKNVPNKCFKRNMMQRLALNVGVNLGPIDDGEFSDLYRGVSPMLGINYKIIRVLAISAGGIMMKRTNKNLLIEDKNITIQPYVGLSLDVDITNGLQKITGKLF